MLKRPLRFSGFKLGLIITLLFCLLKCGVFESTDPHRFRFLDSIENTLLDLKFLMRGGPTTEAQRRSFQEKAHVVIAAVDEKSTRMEDLGLWPWPRAKVAELVRRVNECGAKVIGFDMVFPEPDSSRAEPVVRAIKERYGELAAKDAGFEQELDRIHAQVSGDRKLAQALAEVDKVVLGYFFFTEEREIADLDPKDIQEGKDQIGFGTISFTKPYPGTDPATALPNALGVRANLPVLADEAEYYGFFNQSPDHDRIYRRVPMVFAFDGNLYPSLSLQVLSTYYGQPVELFVHCDLIEDYGWIRDDGTVRLFIGPLDMAEERIEIPVEQRGKFRVNFYGRQKTFRHVSAGDLIHGEPEACDAVRDKVVLMGATTMGIYDLRPNPFEPNFPGVEIHASVIENVITGRFMVRPDTLVAWELGFILLVGILLSWFLNRYPLTIGLVVTLGVMLGIGAGDFLFLFLNGLQAHVVLPGLHLVTLFLGIAVYRYATEEREKSKIRHAFQFYLSSQVIDTMLQDTSKLKLGGERRELTVLFSDIRGFTTISEGLAPEALAELLNEYLTPMTEIVFRYSGTLDKYIGDAVMAIFGAPLPFADHARAACKCALDMMEELGRMQPSWRERGLPELDIGIGVNTGPMSVGNMGSAKRFDYTVLGDHVNLGSRLEGLNKQYGTHIIVSEFTQQTLGDHFTTRELDSVRVQGRLEPVRIYELLHWGPPDREKDAWVGAFHLALEAYKLRRWEEAVAGFEALAEDGVSRMYVARCRQMRANPPGSDWDGVFDMKAK